MTLVQLDVPQLSLTSHTERERVEHVKSAGFQLARKFGPIQAYPVNAVTAPGDASSGWPSEWVRFEFPLPGAITQTEADWLEGFIMAFNASMRRIAFA